jgi:hypothetical protein
MVLEVVIDDYPIRGGGGVHRLNPIFPCGEGATGKKKRTVTEKDEINR